MYHLHDGLANSLRSLGQEEDSGDICQYQVACLVFPKSKYVETRHQV